MFQVAEATLDDIPKLCDLLTILFTQEIDFQPDRDKQSEGLRKIIECPQTGRIFVLRDRTTVIGMVNLLFTVSTALGGRVAILEDMVVHPDHRGNGAGSTLIQDAIEFAKASGCLRITLLTDRTNAPAILFYQRHGFILSEMIPLRLLLSG
jgi:GNAT superfamily N-acetyltransferase